MTYLRLLGVYLRVGVLNELEYRANFYFQVLQVAISLATGFAGLAVVFSHTRTLGGWTADELIALLGVYTLVGGVINLIIQPSMQKLMEDVRQGTLDFTLTKPEDSQLLISVSQIQVWKLVDIVMGLLVTLVALVRLGERVGIWQGLAFGIALLAGSVIIYCFWLALATCSFWFVRVDNILVIFQGMYQAGKWPVGIYPPWLRAALTFLVPVAFATTVPAEAVAGRLTLPTLGGALLLAATLFAFSRWFWRTGIRFYSGASA
jgi:ABC-2 type transport system permease protein